MVKRKVKEGINEFARRIRKTFSKMKIMAREKQNMKEINRKIEQTHI